MEKIGDGAKKAEKEELEKMPKCIVLFRPHKGYKGEYGFDWIRLGNNTNEFNVLEKFFIKINQIIEGNKTVPVDKTINNTKGNEYNTLSNLGKYYLTDNQGNRFVYPDINGWSDDFEEDVQMSIMLKSEYNFLGSKIYGSVLTILPNTKAKLQIHVYVENIENMPADSKLIIYSENEDFFNIPKDGKEVNFIKGEWCSEEFELECKKEFNANQKIIAKIESKKNKVSLECGILTVLANDENHRRPISILLIPVKYSINKESANPLRKHVLQTTFIGKAPQNSMDKLDFILKQAYISTNIIERDTPLNIPQNNSISYKNAFGLLYPEVAVLDVKLDDLDNWFNAQLSNDEQQAYSDFYKIYFFDLPAYSVDDNNKKNGNILGFSNMGKSCVLFKKHEEDDTTIVHELLHCLLLSHTFVNKDCLGVMRNIWPNDPSLNQGTNFSKGLENAKYTYRALTTDNVMDYSHWKNINKISLFYWQWKLINDELR